MRINGITLIFPFILALILPGCNKENDCYKGICIQGEWIWLESVGGIGGWTLTPESEGLSKRLFVSNDIYKEFVNDSLVFESKYELGPSDEPLLETSEMTFIKFESGEEMIIRISDGKLVLIDLCSDCYNHTYARK